MAVYSISSRVPLLPTEAQVSPAFSCLKRSQACPARKTPGPLPPRAAGVCVRLSAQTRPAGVRAAGRDASVTLRRRLRRGRQGLQADQCQVVVERHAHVVR